MILLRERAGEYTRVDRGRLPPLRQFVLIVDRLPAPDELEELPGAATIRWEPGSPTLGIQFDWPAVTLADAIVAAVRQVEALGVDVIRVDARDWVTLGDIAERIGRSREAVRLWSLGRLGPGGFPPPLNLGRDTSFYSWAEVLPWLRGPLGLSLPDEEPVLAAANLALQLRGLAHRVGRMEALTQLLRAVPALPDPAESSVGDDDVIEEG